MALHVAAATALEKAQQFGRETDMNLRLLCGSVSLFLEMVDDPGDQITLTCGTFGAEVVEQLRGILAQVNPDPDQWREPTPAEIAAMEAEPGYQESKARVIAAGMKAFRDVWNRSHPDKPIKEPAS